MLTGLHACLLEDNASVILTIRTVASEALEGQCRIRLESKRSRLKLPGFNPSSAIYQLYECFWLLIVV